MPEQGERPKINPQMAMQRHANYYLRALMEPEIAFPQITEHEALEKQLHLEAGQIYEALKRVENEDVEAKYHPGMIRIKFEALVGNFVPVYLAKLMDGTITTDDDLRLARTAINLVEAGQFEYPANVKALQTMYHKRSQEFEAKKKAD